MKTNIRIKNNNKLKIIEDKDSILFPVYSYIKNNNYIKDYIYKDTLIDNSYTSISGYINNIKYMYFNNKLEECLEIKNDLKEETLYESCINKEFNNLNKLEFLNLLKEKELYNIYNLCNIDSNILYINTIDDLYTYNNIYNIKNNKENILEYINTIANILNIKRIIILIKNSNEVGIDSFINFIGLYPNIEIQLIKNVYITNIEDYITLDNYILLSSIDIMNIISNCLYNKRLDTKYISIYNIEDNSIRVVLVKKYISLLSILNNIEDKDIYYNGLYKGYKIKDINMYIVDDYLNSIFIVPKNYKLKCINCTACSRVCPSNIDVLSNLKCNKSNKDCINCGLCNYVCPSNINIRDILSGEKNEK